GANDSKPAGRAEPESTRQRERDEQEGEPLPHPSSVLSRASGQPNYLHGEWTVDLGAVAELSAIVLAPAPHGVGRPPRAHVAIAGSDRNDVGQEVGTARTLDLRGRRRGGECSGVRQRGNVRAPAPYRLVGLHRARDALGDADRDRILDARDRRGKGTEL